MTSPSVRPIGIFKPSIPEWKSGGDLLEDKLVSVPVNPVYEKHLPHIQKRDGRIVRFEFLKVVNAIKKAMLANKEGSETDAYAVAHKAVGELVRIAKAHKNFVPTVEGCQDEVERQLMLHDCVVTAKAYILYRAKRAELRKEHKEAPEHVRSLAEQSHKYFKDNPLGEFVYLRSYSRWIEPEQRRETWIETVKRYMDFMRENLEDKLTEAEYVELHQAILNQEVMPSMRAMQFAGEPARRCNTCFYNCAFVAPTKLTDFAEIMYLSMQGCGVGYAVESQNVQQLPQIARQNGDKLQTWFVEDTKEGWCDALTLGLEMWYGGRDIEFDFSQVRPQGARLKTMGGRASGPDPLRALLDFVRKRVLRCQGRRLRNIDVHDIICNIGDCVVSGGVRRTAMISLSDLDDIEMRDAKKGQFYTTASYRRVANNSAVYETKPTTAELMDEWVALMKSGSGERGIFNRGSLIKTMPERRIEFFKSKGLAYIGRMGANPCVEINLQPKQFCNLSEIIARSWDTVDSLKRKARLASILGTYQATLTKFSYISDEWGVNCREERLLGVSITGQWDCPVVRNAETMDVLRKVVVWTNVDYAERFGINQSTASTCVKPSGTISQTFDCSSGIHRRNSKFYIRRIRISATDALFKMVRDQGLPYHPEVGQIEGEAHTYVLEFPVKAPPNSEFKNDHTAIEQLEYWKAVKLNWCEHNPSCTVSVGEEEWIAVVSWIYDNWDIVGGLSFLPREDTVYNLAPYEEIDEERYNELIAAFPEIDYSRIVIYEKSDETEQKKELACAGGDCEIL